MCGVNSRDSLSLWIYLTVVYFVCPVVIMVCCYGALFRISIHSRRRLVPRPDSLPRTGEAGRAPVGWLQHLLMPTKSRGSGPEKLFSSATRRQNSSIARVTLGRVTALSLSGTPEKQPLPLAHGTFRQSHIFWHATRDTQLSEIQEITDSDITNEKYFGSESAAGSCVGGSKPVTMTSELRRSSVPSLGLDPDRQVARARGDAREGAAVVTNGSHGGGGSKPSEQAAHTDGPDPGAASASSLVGTLSDTQATKSSGSLSLSPATTQDYERDEKARRQNMRLTTAFVLIILTFIVSFLPYFILRNAERYTNIPEPIIVIALLMAYANSMYNPVLYGWGSVSIRRGYRRMFNAVLQCRCCRRRRLRQVGNE